MITIVTLAYTELSKTLVAAFYRDQQGTREPVEYDSDGVPWFVWYTEEPRVYRQQDTDWINAVEEMVRQRLDKRWPRPWLGTGRLVTSVPEQQRLTFATGKSWAYHKIRAQLDTYAKREMLRFGNADYRNLERYAAGHLVKKKQESAAWFSTDNPRPDTQLSGKCLYDVIYDDAWRKDWITQHLDASLIPYSFLWLKGFMQWPTTR